MLSSPNLLMTQLRESAPDVVLLDIDLAVRALKEGASDFVVKPWDNAKLLATLRSAMALRKSRKEVKRLKEKQSVLNAELNKENEFCWGRSTTMQELLRMVEKVADTDANVLITGENGTGKEVIARKIHQLSARSGESLVTVDMGAITESLFESELFGHVKGAFREDLLYRINTIHLEVPPLRQRKEDIPLLADFFLRNVAGKYRKQGLRLSAGALEKLAAYAWPGNVRELAHSIEKAVILSDRTELQAADFFLNTNNSQDDTPESMNLEDMERRMIAKAMKRFDNNISSVASELGIP